MKKVLFSIELNERNLYRRDYIIKKFSKYKDISKSSILEIGIGNGKYGFLFGDRFEQYFGIDIDKEYVELAKENIPKNAKVVYKIGNAEKIPFRRKFDILFYPSSWHFINNFSEAMGQAKRVLKDNGIIAILEPSNNSGWADPRLRKDSPKFDKKLFYRKIKSLERGRNAILSQKKFQILEDEFNFKKKFRFYILKSNKKP